MRNVAFKRAKNTQAKGLLHDEFIVEHAYTDLFPKGFHKPEDGYEILTEEEFQAEWAKNDSYHADFLEEKRKLEKAEQASADAAAQKAAQEMKKKREEYEQFQRWMKSQGKR